MPVAEMLAKDPAAIILSGGPSSVYEPGAPALDPALFDNEVPVFGICYGFQAMAQALGGTVAHTGSREYGRTAAHRPGRHAAARAAGRPAGVDEPRRQRRRGPAGLRGHRVHAGRARSPRSRTSPPGGPACSSTPRWRTPSRARRCSSGSCTTSPASSRPGPRPTSSTTRWPRSARRSATSRCICGLSGGVDSAVAAALVHKAIGDQLTCVFVDHGLLRAGRGRAGREGLRGRHRHPAQGGRRVRRLPRPPGRGDRPGAEAQDHRSGVHPHVRGRGPRAGRRAAHRVPGAGHALPGRGRVRRRHRHRQHQVAPQRRRPARRPAVRADRAAAHAVQGRGARARRRAGPARRDRPAPPVPRARAWRSGSSARSTASGSTSCAPPT